MSGPKTAIHACLHPGESGGVEPFVMALVRSLGQLDGDDRQVVLTSPDAPDWLDDSLGPRQEKVVWRPGRSLDELDVEVLHFPYQDVHPTTRPYVFNPHDLQHLHLPEFFAQGELERREQWRTWCREAKRVVASSHWVRDDLVRAYGLAPDAIDVVLLGPPTQTYVEIDEPTLRDVARRHGLAEDFAYYPAQTWPHKNHAGLLDALVRLRDRGLTVPLVCTGKENTHFLELAARLQELDLVDQVRFLGFVSTEEVSALYRLARCVVVPTLFEAGSFPMYEAFAAGTPVACSNVTSLPELADGGALLFDPRDPAAIASALEKAWRDVELRALLAERGRQRLGEMDWRRTAAGYRNVYRRCVGLPELPLPAELAALPEPVRLEPAAAGATAAADAGRRDLAAALRRCRASVAGQLESLERVAAERLAALLVNVREVERLRELEQTQAELQSVREFTRAATEALEGTDPGPLAEDGLLAQLRELVERTADASRKAEELGERLAALRASRWVRIGGRLGLAPDEAAPDER